eukprot:10016723-Lingulodinium_polyedra.AAC.1
MPTRAAYLEMRKRRRAERHRAERRAERARQHLQAERDWHERHDRPLEEGYLVPEDPLAGQVEEE